VARMLDLPYPGGPQIDRLAAEGEESINFPRAWLEDDSFDFSFSGLKSSVINRIHNAAQRGETVNKEDVAASFQASVVDVLTTKTWKAAQKYHAKQVIVAGGVAANQGLRKSLEAKFDQTDIPLLIPPLNLCTDNAAMISAAGFVNYKQGKRSGWDLNANPSLVLS
ncbi:tRNA (adenosine(37)-N6)-threonylcarbamoyltransferase complex transferase subunit TsaD, partial [Lentibacillus sp.]|uniref:tRNA (adenosine(37)-N6)-threonylcarbamoyltransferase complex transferase subunit TsaD n=1 Tax=Lentibacillus sp. TaxID=1925746 RepID=UPI002BFCD863|nr:tRNA (adenosine(37)-N6)-threonylcarbamoyltransferase complex transferase subunit TsaD [Lentibacillus sp.]